MGAAIAFSLKVWAVVIFIVPIIAGLLIDSTLLDGVFYFFAVVYGMFFSVPALLIFILIASIINKRAMLVIYKKSILAVIGFIITFTTFQLIGGSLIENLWAPYCIILVIAILIFKLDPPEKPVEEIETSD